MGSFILGDTVARKENTHRTITIVDAGRWGLNYTEKRKWNYQMRTDFNTDPAIVMLSSDAKIIFIELILQSLRYNSCTLNVCLEYLYRTLNVPLADTKRTLNELVSFNIIELDKEVRTSYKTKQNKTEQNKTEENSICLVPQDDVNASIISYMNNALNKKYKHSSKKTNALITARRNENFTIEDFKKVIDVKNREWKNDEKMKKFLRPETLFGQKFETYLNEWTEDVYKPSTLTELFASKFKNSGEPEWM